MWHLITVTFVFIAMSCTGVDASLLEKLNFYASQNQYAAQIFHLPFSMENVLSSSLELALQTCQYSLRWRQWNCPSADFFYRRNSNPFLLDREDAFVHAITAAATLYTITKDCSSGMISDCGRHAPQSTPMPNQCSDNPSEAEELYNKHFKAKPVPAEQYSAMEFYNSVQQHNLEAVTKLLRQSLVKQCSCVSVGAVGCLQEVCTQSLKPFNEIALDIMQMYDEALQLTHGGDNTIVVWQNIPLDALVYTRESPNYCEPDAVPFWNGMSGRQCSFAESTNEDESLSCQNLCYKCGYQVRPQNVVTEIQCNCKFIWGYQVQCEMCVSVKQEFYCY